MEKQVRVKKERKPNWKEVYAKVEDIKAFLNDRVLLRHNVITGRVEYRELCYVPLHLGGVIKEWQPISDRIVNSLWAAISL